METDVITGSATDVRKFASWYKATLVKSLDGLDDSKGLTEHEKFGLRSLSERLYAEAVGNLKVSVDVIMSDRMRVIREVLNVGKDAIGKCASEYKSRFADSDPESVEDLMTRVRWLEDMITMKL